MAIAPFTAGPQAHERHSAQEDHTRQVQLSISPSPERLRSITAE